MSETPTPETDNRIGIISNGSNVVDASWARQLERERDEARQQNCEPLFSQRELPKVIAERDQLLKVVDEQQGVIQEVLDYFESRGLNGRQGYFLPSAKQRRRDYNALPHVIERNKS